MPTHIHPNIKAFLELIGRSEGANYNVLFGGKTFSDYSKHPNICVPFRDTCSTAAGKYQILKPTYDSVKYAAQVTDFTPDSQDKCAIALIRRRGAYDDILEGKIELAIKKCGNEWASLGYNKYNQPTHRLEQLITWYNEYLTGTAPVSKKKNFVIIVILVVAVLLLLNFNKYTKWVIKSTLA
jgi:muramidase (phage lysozyme)